MIAIFGSESELTEPSLLSSYRRYGPNCDSVDRQIGPPSMARIPRARTEKLRATWRPRTTWGVASFRRSYKDRGFEKLEIKLQVA